MKTYYHVSRDIDRKIEVFTPKIPDTFLPHGNEDRGIKRVCLAEGFIDCMNAINYILDKDVYNEGTKLYKPLRVYKFDLDETKVVQPEEVYQHGVHDAIINKECWSLSEIHPVESFIITPTYISRTDWSPVHIGYMDFERGHFPDGIPGDDDE